MASEASYVYIRSGKKFIKMSKIPEACGQTVLPDRSIWIGQNLMENAKIENFSYILSDIQALWSQFILGNFGYFISYHPYISYFRSIYLAMVQKRKSL